MCLTHDEVTPESYLCLRVICRKSRCTRKCIDFTEDRVDLFICESTVRAVDDTIELSLRMKTESEIIMDSFTLTDIFSPGELDFITISIDLR